MLQQQTVTHPRQECETGLSHTPVGGEIQNATAAGIVIHSRCIALYGVLAATDKKIRSLVTITTDQSQLTALSNQKWRHIHSIVDRNVYGDAIRKVIGRRSNQYHFRNSRES